jgi:hypothetical protein
VRTERQPQQPPTGVQRLHHRCPAPRSRKPGPPLAQLRDVVTSRRYIGKLPVKTTNSGVAQSPAHPGTFSNSQYRGGCSEVWWGSGWR